MPTSEPPLLLLLNILKLALLCPPLAIVIFLAWAFLIKRGLLRQRLIVASLSSFLFLVAVFASAATLVFFVQLPAFQRYQVDVKYQLADKVSVDIKLPYAWSSVILSAAGPGLIFASVGLLVWAFFRQRGMRKRVLLTSLCCFLLFVASSAANYTLVYSIQSPILTRYLINTDSLVSVGEHVPTTSVTALDGTPVRLSELNEKVVLLNFFATWCPPCINELPHLQEIWDDLHGNENFTMLVVNVGESHETVAEFKAENGFTFPIALDPDKAAFRRFADGGVPKTYLLSRDGTILFQLSGFSEDYFWGSEWTRLRPIIDAEIGNNGVK